LGNIGSIHDFSLGTAAECSPTLNFISENGPTLVCSSENSSLVIFMMNYELKYRDCPHKLEHSLFNIFAIQNPGLARTNFRQNSQIRGNGAAKDELGMGNLRNMWKRGFPVSKPS
jgi:hypothetical protein